MSDTVILEIGPSRPGTDVRAHPHVRVAEDRPTGVQHGEVLAHVRVVGATEVGDEPG